MTGIVWSGIVSLALAGGSVGFPPGLADAEAEVSAAIGVEEVKAHVYRLASPDFEGRRGPGAARASRHIATLFESIGLEPAFDGSYFQSIPNYQHDADRETPGFLGRNVAAVLPGADPALKDEWIVLSAHFDHLGRRGEALYPGADDNASGVAMLIEVAEALVLSGHRPRRTVVFVAFDLEEAGLLGSRYFAAHPPRDIRKLKTFVTADMLGRSMANLMDDHLFLMGSESSKRLTELVKEVPTGDGLHVGRLGADIIGTRSDYGPFRDRKVPFLFLSTGQHPDYHSPRDLPDRIDYHRLQRISCWVQRLVERLADDPEAPEWDPSPEADIAEAKTIHTLLARVLEEPSAFPLTEQQHRVVENVHRQLGVILERGSITRGERTWLIWTSRILLVTVF